MFTGADRNVANALHDLYDNNQDGGNLEVIWQYLVDEDDDPIMGDFGKVDLVSAKDDWQTADNETTLELEACAADDSPTDPTDNQAWLPVDGPMSRANGCKTPDQGKERRGPA